MCFESLAVLRAKVRQSLSRRGLSLSNCRSSSYRECEGSHRPVDGRPATHWALSRAWGWALFNPECQTEHVESGLQPSSRPQESIYATITLHYINIVMLSHVHTNHVDKLFLSYTCWIITWTNRYLEDWLVALIRTKLGNIVKFHLKFSQGILDRSVHFQNICE